jgi:phosphatidylglycerophosphatase C
MTEIIAVFDLEGTLCQSGKLIWHELIRRRSRKFGGIFLAVFHILHLVLINFLFKLKLIGERQARFIPMESMAFLLVGFKISEVEELAELISQKVAATLRPDMGKVLAGHKEQGHRVILASGQFQPFLEAIGRRLGVESILGTTLETKGSKYTGKVPDMCFAEYRVSRLKEHIGEKGWAVDYTRSLPTEILNGIYLCWTWWAIRRRFTLMSD